MDNEKFIKDRITELRLSKGVSEYKMSLDLGHAKNYIRNITSEASKTVLPSMREFFYICEYFNITPYQFFDTKTEYQHIKSVNELLETVASLDSASVDALVNVAKRMNKE